MYSSSHHVIHAISSPSGRGMSVDYKSVFRFAISCTVLEKWAKKSENREIWANFEPPPPCKFFFWGGGQNFETSFGYSFSGTIARKSLDHAPDPKGVGKNFAPPPNFFGGWRGPHGVHKLDIMTQL